MSDEKEFEAKDVLGRPIQVGSLITYPVRSGSKLWMSHAVVSEIEIVDGFHGTRAKLKVCSVSFDDWEASINVSKTSVTALERVTVLPEALLDVLVPWQARLLAEQSKIVG